MFKRSWSYECQIINEENLQLLLQYGTIVGYYNLNFFNNLFTQSKKPCIYKEYLQ